MKYDGLHGETHARTLMPVGETILVQLNNKSILNSFHHRCHPIYYHPLTFAEGAGTLEL